MASRRLHWLQAQRQHWANLHHGIPKSRGTPSEKLYALLNAQVLWGPMQTFEVVEASLPLLPLPLPAFTAFVALLPFPFMPDSLFGWLLPWHCLVALLPLPLLPLPLPGFSLLLLFLFPSLLPSPPSPPEFGALPSPERSISYFIPCFCPSCSLVALPSERSAALG